MRAAWKRIRENYILLWLFIGLGLVSFTAGVQVNQRMALASIDQLEVAVKQQVMAAR